MQVMWRDDENRMALQNVKNMFVRSIDFLQTNSNFHPGVVSLEPADPYWKHARYVLDQLWGMKDGFNTAALASGVRMIDMIDLVLINSNAEFSELLQVYSPELVKKRREFQMKTMPSNSLLQVPNEDKGNNNMGDGIFGSDIKTPLDAERFWEKKLAKGGRCSAFVKLADESADVFFGHTTWDDYSKMTRLFKYYNFHLPGSYANANTIAMSSYPGCVSSTDEFYQMDSGVVVADTSLEILNTNLYNRVKDFPAN